MKSGVVFAIPRLKPLLTRGVAAALVAFAVEASPLLAAGTLPVHVTLDFDRSITSSTVKRLAKAEAAAIWSPYGVDLEWADEGVSGGGVCLDVMVERSARRRDEERPVLAKAVIVDGELAHAPIRISFDAVDALLESKYPDHSGFHDVALGTALGRVMAHELGHVLLGAPGYHDTTGLMRPSLPVDDLSRGERSRFKLANFSIERLRTRIASFSVLEMAKTCAIR